VDRYRREGLAGLQDRSSRPHRLNRPTPQRVVEEIERLRHRTQRVPALALPTKPSIAVLPFHNISRDPEQEYFADGMVDEIITGLSRIKWLSVISRNSSFIY
jgi:TolB-like protein